MVAARLLKHVRHQFRRDRRPALLFFVLSRVREQGQNRCDPFCACNFASVYHDTEFHKGRIDLATACIDNVDIVFAHRLDNANGCLANSTRGHFGFTYG